MNPLIISTIILTTMISACTNSRLDKRKSEFAGMYKLYISENQDSNSVWHENHWTKGDNGYIVYDKLGPMADQITQERCQGFQWLSKKESIIPERVQEKIDSISVGELKDAEKNSYPAMFTLPIIQSMILQISCFIFNTGYLGNHH